MNDPQTGSLDGYRDGWCSLPDAQRAVAVDVEAGQFGVDVDGLDAAQTHVLVPLLDLPRFAEDPVPIFLRPEPYATSERLLELERQAAQETRKAPAYVDVTASLSKSISVPDASFMEKAAEQRADDHRRQDRGGGDK